MGFKLFSHYHYIRRTLSKIENVILILIGSLITTDSLCLIPTSTNLYSKYFTKLGEDITMFFYEGYLL